MARVIVKNNTIQAKLVYYGPGLCGKTTNLQWVNRNLAGGQELMSLATEGDRTIFFDFMPLELGKLRGMDVQFKLYTVPGQVRYNQTRKMVLKNVDGVVFVADSQPQMMDANLESFDNLFNNLSELGINADELAIVLQYNKRDLPDVASREALDAAMNRNQYPTFLASAHTGEGVVETLKEACRLVLARLAAQLPETGRFKTAQAAPGATSKAAQSVAAAETVRSGAQSHAASAAQSARRSPSGSLRKAAVASTAQSVAAARPASQLSAAAAEAVVAPALQPAPTIALKGGVQPAAAERLAPPAEAPSPAAAVARQPRPAADVDPIASRSAAEASSALEQAVAQATRLVVELKAELEAVRKERAQNGTSNVLAPLAKIAPQIVTKADLEAFKGAVPTRADLEAFKGAVPTRADLEALKGVVPTRADLEALKGAVPTKADLQSLRDGMAALANKADVETLIKSSASPGHQATTRADLEPLVKACDVLRTKIDTVDFAALSERLAALPTKAEVEKLQKQVAARNTMELERAVERLNARFEQLKPSAEPRGDFLTKADLAGFVEQLKATRPNETGGDRLTKADLAGFVEQLKATRSNEPVGERLTKADLAGFVEQLKATHSNEPVGDRLTKADLAELVEQMKAANASSKSGDVLTKADLAGFVEQLKQLPTRADLEKSGSTSSLAERIDKLVEKVGRDVHAEKGDGAALPAELAALTHVVSTLASRADVDVLAKEMRSLSAALVERSERTAFDRPEPSSQRSAERPTLLAPPVPPEAYATVAPSAEKQQTAEAVAVANTADAAETPAAAPAPLAIETAPNAAGEEVSTTATAEGAEPASGDRAASRPPPAEASPEEPPPAEASPEESPADEASREKPPAPEASPAQTLAAEASPAEPPAGEAAPAQTPVGEAAPPVDDATPVQTAAVPASPEQPTAATASPEEPTAAAASPSEPAAPEAAATDGGTPTAGEEPTATAPAEPPAAAAAPQPAEQKPSVDEYAGNREHQNAARIARVMMADLYLYNKDQVDAGIVHEDFYERNKEALADMRLTYESRVKAEIRSARDYLQLAIEEFIKKKKKQLVPDA